MDKNARLYYGGYSGLTAATVGNKLGRSLTNSDSTYLTIAIASAEKTIARLCGRNFLHDIKNGSYYETFDDSYESYELTNYPIKEVKKIVLDGVDVYVKDSEDNTLELGQDFFVYEREIVFAEKVCSSRDIGRQSLKIYYNIEKFWGEEVEIGILQWITDHLNSKEYGSKDVKKFTFASLSVEFNQKDPESKLPPFIEQIVNIHKRILI